MIYIFIHLILGFFTIVKLKNNNNKIIHSVVFWGLYLFVGLRYEVGADWFNYLEISNSLSEVDFVAALLITDPAYAFLNYFSNTIGIDIWLTNSICTIILLTGLFRFISVTGGLYFPLFISFPYIIVIVGMGVTRQAAALGLVFIAFIYYRESKIQNAYIALFAAVLFHKTAFIIVLAFSITKLFEIKKNRLAVYSSSLLVIICGIILYSKIMDLFHFYNDGNYESRGAMIRAIYFFCVASFAILHRKILFKNYKEKKMVTILSGLILLIAPIVYITPVIVDRLLIYFWPIVILVYSRVYYTKYSIISYFGVIKIVMILSNFIYFYYWIANSYYYQEHWRNYNNFIIRYINSFLF